MCRFLLALDEHVIHVYLQVSSDLLTEHFIDQLLVGCSCIFQSEGHYLVVVETLAGDEGSLFLVLF